MSCSKVREILASSKGDIALKVVNNPSMYSAVREELDRTLPTHTVVLNKTQYSHGLHVVAPLYTPGPVFVSAIDKGSPADLSGDIYIGDQIVDIDGIGTPYMTYGEQATVRRLLTRREIPCSSPLPFLLL
jgi:C-terminal processing protease CtpA/Prc